MTETTTALRATHVRCAKCSRITKAHYHTACTSDETPGPFPRHHKPPYAGYGEGWCAGIYELGTPVTGAVKESSGCVDTCADMVAEKRAELEEATSDPARILKSDEGTALGSASDPSSSSSL